jgi:hypothetical protein
VLKAGDTCWALYSKVDWFLVWPRIDDTDVKKKKKKSKEQDDDDNDDNDNDDDNASDESSMEAVNEAKRRVPSDGKLISATLTPLIGDLLQLSDDEFNAAQQQHNDHVKAVREAAAVERLFQSMQKATKDSKSVSSMFLVEC